MRPFEGGRVGLACHVVDALLVEPANARLGRALMLNGPQDDFVERVREGGGSIEKIRYGKSLHEIFSMPNTVVGPYVNKILDFLSAPADSL